MVSKDILGACTARSLGSELLSSSSLLSLQSCWSHRPLCPFLHFRSLIHHWLMGALWLAGFCAPLSPNLHLSICSSSCLESAPCALDRSPTGVNLIPSTLRVPLQLGSLPGLEEAGVYVRQGHGVHPILRGAFTGCGSRWAATGCEHLINTWQKERDKLTPAQCADAGAPPSSDGVRQRGTKTATR